MIETVEQPEGNRKRHWMTALFSYICIISGVLGIFIIPFLLYHAMKTNSLISDLVEKSNKSKWVVLNSGYEVDEHLSVILVNSNAINTTFWDNHNVYAISDEGHMEFYVTHEFHETLSYGDRIEIVESDHPDIRPFAVEDADNLKISYSVLSGVFSFLGSIFLLFVGVNMSSIFEIGDRIEDHFKKRL